MTKIMIAVVWGLVFLFAGNSLSAETQAQPKSIKIMTQSQIDDAVNNYRALLEKNVGRFESDVMQKVLSQSGFANEQYGVLYRRTEMINKMIIRKVKVSRARTPQEAIDATGRDKHLNSDLLSAMPRSAVEEVEVCFLPLAKHTNARDVQQILKDYGLEPDPYALAAVNEADPAFADSHPNGTQWINDDGKYCYLLFSRWKNKRYVFYWCNNYIWDDYWWIGGVRKP